VFISSSTSSSHSNLHLGLMLGWRPPSARGQEREAQFLDTWCIRLRARGQGSGLLMSRGGPRPCHQPNTTGVVWRCLCTLTKEELKPTQCKCSRCSRWAKGIQGRRRLVRDQPTFRLPRAQGTRGLEGGLG